MKENVQNAARPHWKSSGDRHILCFSWQFVLLSSNFSSKGFLPCWKYENGGLWLLLLLFDVSSSSGMSILEDQARPYSFDTFLKELILRNLSKREKLVIGAFSTCSSIPSATSLHSLRHVETRPGSDPFAEVKFSLQVSARSENLVSWICYLNLLLSHIIFSMHGNYSFCNLLSTYYSIHLIFVLPTF